MLAKITIFISVVLMAGCTVIPDSIQVDEGTTLLEYQQVTSNPENNIGKIVRWGGVIAEITNLPDATMVEVVDFPLRSYGRPSVSNQSMGRFRVYIDGFIDPVVFEKGRAITFTGKVTGSEEGMVGEHKFVFPTIQSTGYHLWKELEQVNVRTISMWPYGNYWGWPYRPYHQRVFIRRSNDSPSGGASTPIRTQQPSRSSQSRNNSVRTIDKEP
ncbi:Slp family lipoprotein [Aliiglaciecola sp. 3_MG-2023]|uniref:Slp family lipoprotein n=1 Tax=Aliiglaciecola sp. 3_MG-2023 TaxID=3062644 RepID=UPI0026E1C7CA|nr:Slp family lipoprotein [Aliiglaciecola sp. 3_MG-2023]MDO6694677.1 Slp family lipoprotein [Aliiglaciecola sp. 3_MG-2023]